MAYLGSCITYKLKKSILLEKCADLQLALIDRNHYDIEGLQLYQELSVLFTLLHDKCTCGRLEMLRFIITNCQSEFSQCFYSTCKCPYPTSESYF